MSITLVRALRTTSASRIAFVGAGGKTTAMFQLARDMLKQGGAMTVIVTATSHLGVWQIPLADIHIIAESPSSLEKSNHQFQGVVLITGKVDRDRTQPLNDHTLNWIHQYCDDHFIPLLIEADGSRQNPLKAWADHEPAIPSFVNQVVQVVGVTGLGKSLSEDHVHRSELFSKLSGLNPGEPVTKEALTRVLKNPTGGLKHIPTHARKTILLNQTDTVELQAIAHGLVKSLMSVYDSVVIASLKQEMIFAVHEPIAGVILAAGESSRFGQAKQLLDWKGKTFVRAVSLTALETGLSPVVVVTGANAEQVEARVRDLKVLIIRNQEWKSGQGSSIKAGVKSLAGAEGVGGAIFLLTDQPQITTSILHALVQRHAESLHPIIAPMVMDRRANPVLFDRVVFPDLMTLEGDVGGRAVFHKHSVEYLPWHDDRLLLDVDTPEMYQRLISDESL
jgi:molybdenum cofactor cytidylyltransferase